MAKYKYEILKDNNGYMFILYPNNITYQEVGRSIYYKTRSECYSAWENFKLYVKINNIDNAYSKYIKIYNQDNHWYFEYIKDNKKIFYRLKGYGKKQSAINIISSIFKNIDAEMK